MDESFNPRDDTRESSDAYHKQPRHESEADHQETCEGQKQAADSDRSISETGAKMSSTVHDEKKALFCGTCKEGFCDEETFASHVLTHAGENPLVCSICNERCFDMDTLKVHLRTHIGDSMSCPLCLTRFADEEAWTFHQLASVRGRLVPAECTPCNQLIYDEQNVNDLIITKREDEVCAEGISGENSNLGRLLNTEVIHPCPKCDSEFVTEESLASHLLDHENKTTLERDTCPESFFDNSALEVRLLRQEAEDNEKCRQCGRFFHRDLSLSNHEEGHMRDGYCPPCSKIVNNAIEVNRRLKPLTSRERPFVCHICDRRYLEKGYLARHMVYHKEEAERPKPLFCPDCNRMFYTADLLAIHRRIHTNEKPFSCVECCKTFSQEAHLRRHVARHSKEKPFGCKKCDGRFSKKEYLKRHVCTRFAFVNCDV